MANPSPIPSVSFTVLIQCTTNLDGEVRLGAVPGHHLPHVIVCLGLLHYIPGDLSPTVVQRWLPGEGDSVGSDLGGLQWSLWRSGFVHHNDLRMDGAHFSTLGNGEKME